MVMIMRNLTSLPLVMGLTVLYCVCRIVTFMKALSLAVMLMDTAIPMDMKIATTTTLTLGYEVTGVTGFYKVGNQGKSSFRLQKPLSESEEILCSLADKSALTRQLYWMRIDAAQQS